MPYAGNGCPAQAGYGGRNGYVNGLQPYGQGGLDAPAQANGQSDGERRRPLTLADQVFLSPLLRNPNSNDPTGILSPPGMFKDSDPTTAIVSRSGWGRARTGKSAS